MKSQINTLRQLQELVLTRDEHHQTGDGSHLDSLNDAIAELQDKLDPQVAAMYQRLYKPVPAGSDCRGRDARDPPEGQTF